MKILTQDAVLRCDHQTGRVKLAPLHQHLVTIHGRAVLVQDDPEGKRIQGCSNSVPLAGIVPCKLTLKVRTGYSSLVRVNGHSVCLDTVSGFTTGTPPGTVDYTVTDPGQDLVTEV